MQEQREVDGCAPPLQAHNIWQLLQPQQPLLLCSLLNSSAEKYPSKSFSTLTS